MASADDRYRAKLAARASGKTEVVVYPPSPPSADAGLRGIEARYQVKLAARKATAESTAAASQQAARAADEEAELARLMAKEAAEKAAKAKDDATKATVEAADVRVPAGGKQRR